MRFTEEYEEPKHIFRLTYSDDSIEEFINTRLSILIRLYQVTIILAYISIVAVLIISYFYGGIGLALTIMIILVSSPICLLVFGIKPVFKMFYIYTAIIDRAKIFITMYNDHMVIQGRLLFIYHPLLPNLTRRKRIYYDQLISIDKFKRKKNQMIFYWHFSEAFQYPFFSFTSSGENLYGVIYNDEHNKNNYVVLEIDDIELFNSLVHESVPGQREMKWNPPVSVRIKTGRVERPIK